MQKVCQAEELSNRGGKKVLGVSVQYSYLDCAAFNQEVVLNLPEESLLNFMVALLKQNRYWKRLNIYSETPSCWFSESSVSFVIRVPSLDQNHTVGIQGILKTRKGY